MKSASIADIETRAPADGRPEDGRRIAFDKAAHDAAVHRTVLSDPFTSTLPSGSTSAVGSETNLAPMRYSFAYQ